MELGEPLQVDRVPQVEVQRRRLHQAGGRPRPDEPRAVRLPGLLQPQLGLFPVRRLPGGRRRYVGLHDLRLGNHLPARLRGLFPDSDARHSVQLQRHVRG